MKAAELRLLMLWKLELLPAYLQDKEGGSKFPELYFPAGTYPCTNTPGYAACQFTYENMIAQPNTSSVSLPQTYNNPNPTHKKICQQHAPQKWTVTTMPTHLKNTKTAIHQVHWTTLLVTSQSFTARRILKCPPLNQGCDEGDSSLSGRG